MFRNLSLHPDDFIVLHIPDGFALVSVVISDSLEVFVATRLVKVNLKGGGGHFKGVQSGGVLSIDASAKCQFICRAQEGWFRLLSSLWPEPASLTSPLQPLTYFTVCLFISPDALSWHEICATNCALWDFIINQTRFSQALSSPLLPNCHSFHTICSDISQKALRNQYCAFWNIPEVFEV